jgi:peptidoglycan/xylan/chitin deacetylase (PgdA/CDA1 family)
MKSIWFMYHDVYGSTPDPSIPKSAMIYHIPVDHFSKQIETIHRSGKPVITASEYLDRKNLDSVVITFDDGWHGVLEHALAILNKYGFQATLFVTRDFIGKRGFLAKEDLASLVKSGMEMGIHGTTHRILSNCRPSEIVEISWKPLPINLYESHLYLGGI